jgi:hypothetical protein
MGWTELLLALAVLALVFQLIPFHWMGLLWAIDVRNWPRSVWIVATWMVLLFLVVIRFGPDVYEDWQQRRARLLNKRAKEENRRRLKEEHKRLALMKDAMKRRVY